MLHSQLHGAYTLLLIHLYYTHGPILINHITIYVLCDTLINTVVHNPDFMIPAVAIDEGDDLVTDIRQRERVSWYLHEDSFVSYESRFPFIFS